MYEVERVRLLLFLMYFFHFLHLYSDMRYYEDDVYYEEGEVDGNGC